MENLIDIKELATRLKMAVGTLYNWANRGSIPFRKIGHSLRFDWGEIVVAIEEKRLGRSKMRSARKRVEEKP